MIRYFVAHPTAANILMFIIVILGLASLPGLNKETFPEIKLYQVKVTVAYHGASAAEVSAVFATFTGKKFSLSWN